MMRYIPILILLLAVRTHAQRYTVVYTDGEVQSGNELLNSYEWSYATNAPSIDEQPLAQAVERIRYIRDYERDARLMGPYIRMANGDVLPGVPSALLPEDEESGQDKRLLVQMISPCQSFRSNSGELAIRIDRVAAIVSSAAAEQELSPATVVLKDGQVISFKSARWSEEGLKLLTGEGLQRVAFSDIDSFRPAEIDVWLALQEDASVPSPEPNDRLVQFRLVNGAVLTGKRMILVEVDRDVLAIQPVWSYAGIRFDTRSDVVSRSYREVTEVPLSLLPTETLEQKTYTGFRWRAQKDQSLRGDELGSGVLRAGQGFATHSYSELAVSLPPGARQFTGWVGIDRAVGEGGCVQSSIYGGEKKDPPLWQSGFLQGGKAPQPISALDVSNQQRLILVTDYGHEHRPSGSDPMDIRDEVDWLFPMVTLDVSPQVPTLQHEARILAQLPAWEGSEALLKDPLTGPTVLTWWGLWRPGIFLDLPEEIRLKHTMQVSVSNAWLQVTATRARRGRGGHEISLNVNGQMLEPRGWVAKEEQGYVRKWEQLQTSKKVAGFLFPMDWDLGHLAGQEVKLELVIRPIDQEAGYPLPLLLLEDIRLRTVIRGWGDEFAPAIHPEVPLETVQPLQLDLVQPGLKLQAGKLANGNPIRMLGWTFHEGYGVPAGSSITYALDPAWKRFVAVVGYTRENWVDVGPYEVLIDDELVFSSSNPTRFGWWNRSEQVAVPIPAGSTSITLRIEPGEAWGAWAQAGFMTTAAPVAASEEGGALSAP